MRWIELKWNEARVWLHVLFRITNQPKSKRGIRRRIAKIERTNYFWHSKSAYFRKNSWHSVFQIGRIFVDEFERKKLPNTIEIRSESGPRIGWTGLEPNRFYEGQQHFALFRAFSGQSKKEKKEKKMWQRICKKSTSKMIGRALKARKVWFGPCVCVCVGLMLHVSARVRKKKRYGEVGAPKSKNKHTQPQKGMKKNEEKKERKKEKFCILSAKRWSKGNLS